MMTVKTKTGLPRSSADDESARLNDSDNSSFTAGGESPPWGGGGGWPRPMVPPPVTRGDEWAREWRSRLRSPRETKFYQQNRNC